MLKNMPWFKSMLFWIVLISIIILIFRCSTQQEQNKMASDLGYERLYDCMHKIPADARTNWFKQIQQQLATPLTQKTMMQLIQQCNVHKTAQPQHYWINKIKQL